MVDDLSRLLSHASGGAIGRQDIYHSTSPTIDYSVRFIRDMLEKTLEPKSNWNPPRMSPQVAPQRPDNDISAVLLHELLQRMRNIEQTTSAMLGRRALSSSPYRVDDGEDIDDNQNDLGSLIQEIHRLTASVGPGLDNYHTDGMHSYIQGTGQRSTRSANQGSMGGNLGTDRRPRDPENAAQTQRRETKTRSSTPSHRRRAHFEDQPEEEEVAERVRQYMDSVSTTLLSRRGTPNMNTKAIR